MSEDPGRDRIFSRQLSDVKAFEFNEEVANVFDDMISRSVPGYSLLLRMIGLYAGVFVTPGSRVYDLGCSLGAASLVVAEQARELDCRIIAVDNSSAMIEKCRQYGPDAERIDWLCEDIRLTPLEPASMIILNLTLQFIQPGERPVLLDRIFRALDSGGVLVLSEKIVFEDALEDARMTALYQGYKKTMGYSDLEISQKRNALENVLVPDT
ncbi:MAG TPA: carboxy-S-adenosyl-L-methionine synthase CmoA, partial [Gammaproteobacteria bacterium]|nr:carboxy-S-adenosyl-L-methionine synthase CmoA [Gammaproteobacteria bacterium]